MFPSHSRSHRGLDKILLQEICQEAPAVTLVIRLEYSGRTLIIDIHVPAMKIIPVTPAKEAFLDIRDCRAFEWPQCFNFHVLNSSFDDSVLLRSTWRNFQVKNVLRSYKFLEHVFLLIDPWAELRSVVCHDHCWTTFLTEGFFKEFNDFQGSSTFKSP